MERGIISRSERQKFVTFLDNYSSLSKSDFSINQLNYSVDSYYVGKQGTECFDICADISNSS